MSPSTTDSFVSIVGTYQVDPQDTAAFASIAAHSVLATVDKPGCLYYIASQDLAQANVFHLAEGWATQADLDAHLASRDFNDMLEQALKLRILRREIHVSQSHGRVLMS